MIAQASNGLWVATNGGYVVVAPSREIANRRAAAGEGGAFFTVAEREALKDVLGMEW